MTRRDTRSADIVSLLARAAAAHELRRFEERPVVRPHLLAGVLSMPAGEWARYCKRSTRLRGSYFHRQERAI